MITPHRSHVHPDTTGYGPTLRWEEFTMNIIGLTRLARNCTVSRARVQGLGLTLALLG